MNEDADSVDPDRDAEGNEAWPERGVDDVGIVQERDVATRSVALRLRLGVSHRGWVRANA